MDCKDGALEEDEAPTLTAEEVGADEIVFRLPVDGGSFGVFEDLLLAAITGVIPNTPI